MRIVIKVGDFYRHYPEVEMGRFFTDALVRMIRSHPGDQFTRVSSPFFGGPEWTDIPLEEIHMKSFLPGRWATRWMTRLAVAGEIRRHSPQLLLCIGEPMQGTAAIPQLVWMPGAVGDRLLHDNPSWQKKFREGNHFLVTESQQLQQQRADMFSFPEIKLPLVPMSASEDYQPLSWAEKEQIKTRYSGGRDYFITRALFPEKDLLTLLKAFSVFKKKQQSNMQLLIAGVAGEPDHIPYERLENYKYRGDVQCHARMAEEDLMKTIASAYALVQPAEQIALPQVLNALQAQVPVISAAAGSLDPEIGETVRPVEYGNHESIGEALISFYNNEGMRGELIRKGAALTAKIGSPLMQAGLWEAVRSAASG